MWRASPFSVYLSAGFTIGAFKGPESGRCAFYWRHQWGLELVRRAHHRTRMFGSSASDGFARTRVVVKLRAAMGRTEEPAERSAAQIARVLDRRRLILGGITELAGLATLVGCLDEANGGGWACWCCYAIVEVIENSGASIRRGANRRPRPTGLACQDVCSLHTALPGVCSRPLLRPPPSAHPRLRITTFLTPAHGRRSCVCCLYSPAFPPRALATLNLRTRPAA